MTVFNFTFQKEFYLDTELMDQEALINQIGTSGRLVTKKTDLFKVIGGRGDVCQLWKKIQRLSKRKLGCI